MPGGRSAFGVRRYVLVDLTPFVPLTVCFVVLLGPRMMPNLFAEPWQPFGGARYFSVPLQLLVPTRVGYTRFPGFLIYRSHD